MTIYITPQLTFDNTPVKELIIHKQEINERAITTSREGKRTCVFGNEGKDWHTTLGAAKTHLAKCKKDDIKWLQEQVLNLKRAPIVVL